jgi:hypothetical protein
VSLQNYADRVVNYLHDQGYTYAAPDPRGGKFKGGILMDVGNGERVAFLLPTDELEPVLRSLQGYLDDVYPNHNRVLSPPERGGGVITVRVNMTADLAESGAA